MQPTSTGSPADRSWGTALPEFGSAGTGWCSGRSRAADMDLEELRERLYVEIASIRDHERAQRRMRHAHGEALYAAYRAAHEWVLALLPNESTWRGADHHDPT